MRKNGNGEYAFTKRVIVVASLILTILGMVAGMAVAWGSVTQAFGIHATDANIHWSKSALDEAFVPRGEFDAKFGEIQRSLLRIEKRLERE